MLSALSKLTESRICDARDRGEFDNLPGKGKRLELDDDALVPPECRAAYRILKNAGFVPPEVSQLCEAAELRALLAHVSDESGPDGDTLRLRQIQQRLLAVNVALQAHGIDLSNAAGGAYCQQALRTLAIGG